MTFMNPKGTLSMSQDIPHNCWIRRSSFVKHKIALTNVTLQCAQMARALSHPAGAPQDDTTIDEIADECVINAQSSLLFVNHSADTCVHTCTCTHTYVCIYLYTT